MGGPVLDRAPRDDNRSHCALNLSAAAEGLWRYEVPDDLPWAEAIAKVLSSANVAMHYSDIADQISVLKYRTSLGATPAATVASVISTDIKQNGDESTYLRVSRGLYLLRHPPVLPQVQVPQVPAQPEPLVGIEEDEETTAIQALGMFWRRDWVSWTNNPSLLGVQQRNSTPVNFCSQRGVYLLHDGRDTVYVGRTTDQPLGRRLYQHTTDRLNGRWDRFSWFGVLSVSEAGALTEQDVQLSAEQVIIELEAVLIEAMEPPQNRRRGDGLRAIEFIQAEDPALRHKQVLAVMKEFEAKMVQGQ